MTDSGGRKLALAAACIVIVGYASLSYFAHITAAHALGAILGAGPLMLVLVVLTWRHLKPALACLTTMGIGFLGYNAWPWLVWNYQLVSLTDETAVYLILGATFAASLMHRRVALCTRLADRLHGPLGERELGYTRRVTLVWASFFFAVATSSLVLYSFATLGTWSFYINFCVLPMVGVLFTGEYLVRRRVLPPVARVGLVATINSYLAGSHR